MALVYGQIESLKRIRETLDQKGISRFNSIGDINKFIKNYDNQKEELFFKIEDDFDVELDILQAEGFDLQKSYDNLKTNSVTGLNVIISWLKTKCEALASSLTKNPIRELGNWYLLQIFKGMKFIFENNSNRIVWLQTFRTNKRLKSKMKKINMYKSHRQGIISARCAPRFKELEYAKTIVTELSLLIAGAIGENRVLKELRKLTDDCVIFNDFSIDFETPIYNRQENDKIFSIQIDHLLVTNSGIFIIETKNWSKKSIENVDLRSPVMQIRRTSFALFVILNGNRKQKGINFKKHHWGEKKLPIRNVVVMINEKPKENFKFVQIKRLNELNRYISYFDPIFDDAEVNSIVEHLKTIKN